jgi:hypothetical protein
MFEKNPPKHECAPSYQGVRVFKPRQMHLFKLGLSAENAPKCLKKIRQNMNVRVLSKRTLHTECV